MLSVLNAQSHRRPRGEIDVIPLHRRIGRIAERQDGVIDHAQLVELGMAPRRFARAESTGLLTPRHCGVYVFGHDALIQRCSTPPRANRSAGRTSTPPGGRRPIRPTSRINGGFTVR
jgi:hypothetical protein